MEMLPRETPLRMFKAQELLVRDPHTIDVALDCRRPHRRGKQCPFVTKRTLGTPKSSACEAVAGAQEEKERDRRHTAASTTNKAQTTGGTVKPLDEL